MVEELGEPTWGGKNNFFNFMSQHRSLRAASTSGAKRNVMKRFERVEILKKRGQWKEGDRITGLRKTKPEA
jgi:small basic protein (TIGR04137 family)